MQNTTLQWHYTAREDLGILALAGHLDSATAARFTGAIGWVLAHGCGPLILDLTALHSWSPVGQAAVVEAARRLAEQHRPPELTAIPADATAANTYSADPPIAIHSDLAAALAAHGTALAESGSDRQWRSGGWTDDAPPARA